MTVEEVRARIKEIMAVTWDNEKAHSMEDGLRSDVLAAIRDGAENAAELAGEALKTDELLYDRWCA